MKIYRICRGSRRGWFSLTLEHDVDVAIHLMNYTRTTTRCGRPVASDLLGTASLAGLLEVVGKSVTSGQDEHWLTPATVLC